MAAKMEALIEVSLQHVDGSSAKLQVEPGTTAANILYHECSKLPAGCSASLVTEIGQAMEPNDQVWEAQALLPGVVGCGWLLPLHRDVK